MEKRMRPVPACRAWAWVLLLAAGGCAVGPDYRPPQPSTPSAWYGATDHARFPPCGQADLVHWWTLFNDPVLTSLVERAVLGNLDLRQARARVRQARAARGVAAAGLWPTAGGSAGYTRSRTQEGSVPGGASGRTAELFQAGLDAAWELDLFGGARRTVEAAEADLQASIEEERDTLVTLVAEVGLNVLDLRLSQQRAGIARKNLEIQRHSAELTRRRFGAGFVGALDVANAEAQVATTEAQIPVLETSAQQAIYRLSVLTGREPASLMEELSSPAPIPGDPPEIPMLLPSELLLRRPDIRRAEAQIHAATARIGAATADLFPKFNLAGSAGFRGTALDEWLHWSRRVWSFGPAMDWQLFNAGRVLSGIELQKAVQEEALLAYQKTILTALEEVENALLAYSKERERRQALLEAVAANRRGVDLATRLYVQGETDFLHVLDAERSLYASEDALAQSERNLSANLVTLFKALGGGWQAEPTPAGPSTAEGDRREASCPDP